MGFWAKAAAAAAWPASESAGGVEVCRGGGGGGDVNTPRASAFKSMLALLGVVLRARCRIERRMKDNIVVVLRSQK